MIRLIVMEPDADGALLGEALVALRERGLRVRVTTVDDSIVLDVMSGAMRNTALGMSVSPITPEHVRGLKEES